MEQGNPVQLNLKEGVLLVYILVFALLRMKVQSTTLRLPEDLAAFQAGMLHVCLLCAVIYDTAVMQDCPFVYSSNLQGSPVMPGGSPYMLIANLDESITNCLTWDLFRQGKLSRLLVVRCSLQYSILAHHMDSQSRYSAQ